MAAEIAVALVIGQDEDDAGPLLSPNSGTAQGKKGEQKATQLFHGTWSVCVRAKHTGTKNHHLRIDGPTPLSQVLRLMVAGCHSQRVAALEKQVEYPLVERLILLRQVRQHRGQSERVFLSRPDWCRLALPLPDSDRCHPRSRHRHQHRSHRVSANDRVDREWRR